MKIIVPMAGLGDRFVKQGYTDPKPLIEVDGVRIIERIVKMFSPEDEFVFICNTKHLAGSEMYDVLKKLVPNCIIIAMEQHKKGPCYTVQKAYDFIGDDEEVIVTYCDNPYVWDYAAFKDFLAKTTPDGCVLTHSGFHPHTLATTKMAFLKETDGVVSEIKEKESYTSDPQDEHASTGTYYFRKGAYVKKYFDELIEKDINYNGEYYVTLVYNLLIKDGLTVRFFDTPFVTVFGTPEEVEQFEAWQKIIKGGQVKTFDELFDAAFYWIEYNKAYGTLQTKIS